MKRRGARIFLRSELQKRLAVSKVQRQRVQDQGPLQISTEGLFSINVSKADRQFPIESSAISAAVPN